MIFNRFAVVKPGAPETPGRNPGLFKFDRFAVFRIRNIFKPRIAVSGASFNDVEINGQKYNVTYELAFNSVESTVKSTDPGENRLFTISADNPASSHYGDGKLDYKPNQENLSNGTTFGHELAHVMGLGHNNGWSDASGKKSISSVDVSKRDVILKDIVETTQPAVQLVNGKDGTVILTTWRGTSNLNTVSQDNGGSKQREAQYQVKGN